VLHATRPRSILRITDWPPWVLPVFLFGMFALLVTVFLAEKVSEEHARDALLAAVGRASRVRVNGQLVATPSPFLRALQSVHHVPGHHSGPTTPVTIELEGGGPTIAVIIARDSERPTEFWVYRPGPNWHNDPLGQEAGRITVASMDSLLRASRL